MQNAPFPLWPEQASTFAWQVDALFVYITLICLFFGVGSVAAVIYFALKYREKRRFAVPDPIHGSDLLELTWTGIPFVLALTIFVFGTIVFYQLYSMPADGMEVYVVGKQWMWKFQHSTGQREINELHIPVNRRVKLTMTTEDVLHDVFIPAFRTKADVVPGRYTHLWFEATKPGKYRLYCAEYCGLNHSGMGGWVYVMEQRDFDNWLSGNATSQSPIEAGKELFQAKLQCSSCHLDNGAGRGPKLTGIVGKPVKLNNGETITVDETYLRESILNSQKQVVDGYTPIMPTFKGQVNEEQLLSLIAYIKSLSGDTSGITAAPAASSTSSSSTQGASPPGAGNSNAAGNTQTRTTTGGQANPHAKDGR
ncbi:MAG TPA: cytochrome c oxidase subunit II [Pyrinomonadaceae bacterium]|jgi:cytochrome c oxidase subunit 2|nr:cytochrome c oxidase subunit II [Pyrinomonadaceae bacterium]